MAIIRGRAFLMPYQNVGSCHKADELAGAHQETRCIGLLASLYRRKRDRLSAPSQVRSWHEADELDESLRGQLLTIADTWISVERRSANRRRGSV